MRPRAYLLALACLFAATGCADRARLSHEQATGPAPVLPPPAGDTLYVANTDAVVAFTVTYA
jgi:hypothetical protein